MLLLRPVCEPSPSFQNLPTLIPLLGLGIGLVVVVSALFPPPAPMYQLHQEQHALSLRLAQESMLKEARKSWVMTSPNEAFVKLPNERVLYTSPPRTSLDISTPNKFPGTQPYSAKSESGVVYLTNQRVNSYIARRSIC